MLIGAGLVGAWYLFGRTTAPLQTVAGPGSTPFYAPTPTGEQQLINDGTIGIHDQNVNTYQSTYPTTPNVNGAPPPAAAPPPVRTGNGAPPQPGVNTKTAPPLASVKVTPAGPGTTVVPGRVTLGPPTVDPKTGKLVRGPVVGPVVGPTIPLHQPTTEATPARQSTSVAVVPSARPAVTAGVNTPAPSVRPRGISPAGGAIAVNGQRLF